MSKETGERSRVRKYIAPAAAIGAGALLVAGCGSSTPYEVAEHEAKVKYDDAVTRASPAGKFLLQYLRVTTVNVAKHRTDMVGVDEYWHFTIGSACLQSTAYDVSGGSIDVSAEAGGFFSSARASAEGNIPTAAAYAELDPKDPNKLIIQSGHANSVTLRFSGVRGSQPLMPEDPQTRNILETYGCKDGQVFTSEVVNSYIAEEKNPDSPYINSELIVPIRPGDNPRPLVPSIMKG